MQEQILTAAVAFISAVLATVTPFVAAYLTKWLKAKLTAQQLDVARTLAVHAVQVAEELGNQTGASGPDKLAVAAKTFKSLADGVRNLKTLDNEAIYDLIHSALVEFRLVNEPASAGLDLSELLVEPEPDVEFTKAAVLADGKAEGSDTE